MSDQVTMYLRRDFFEKQLTEKIEAHSRQPVPQGENQGYQLGHALGYTDALKEVREMLRNLPDEPKKKTEATKPWHWS